MPFNFGGGASSRLKPRPEDLPLHEDVRWLAAALGRVIQRLEGQESFEIVEQLRVATRARRHGEKNAPNLDELLRTIDGLSVEQCAMAARAFLTSAAVPWVPSRARSTFWQRSVTGPTLPSATRTLVSVAPLRTKAAAMHTFEMACARRVPTLR